MVEWFPLKAANFHAQQSQGYQKPRMHELIPSRSVLPPKFIKLNPSLAGRGRHSPFGISVPLSAATLEISPSCTIAASAGLQPFGPMIAFKLLAVYAVSLFELMVEKQPCGMGHSSWPSYTGLQAANHFCELHRPEIPNLDSYIKLARQRL
jgi:hypothetical protein